MNKHKRQGDTKKLLKWAFYLVLLTFSLHEAQSEVRIEDFFPFGLENGDTRLLEESNSHFTHIQFKVGRIFPFFNDTYPHLLLNIVGFIAFDEGGEQHKTICGALNVPMIVPFWSHLDVRKEGKVFYRETNNKTHLLKASEDISKVFPEIRNLNLDWMFITTWHEVPPWHGGDGRRLCKRKPPRNTFQSILATDGYYSFVMFYYNNITWTTAYDNNGDCDGLGGTPAKAGFDVGNRRMFYPIGGSCTAKVLEIANTSNVNENGKWIFRVDRSFASKPCEGRDQNELLQISPSFVSLMGHLPISIRGPCLNNDDIIECHFHDKSKITVSGKVSKDTAICQVPFLYSTGRIKIELIINRGSFITSFSGYIFATEPGKNCDNFVEFEIDQDHNINLSWNPLLFIDSSEKSRRKRDIEKNQELILNVLENDNLHWIVKGPMIYGLSNSGKYRGSITKEVYELMKNLSSLAVLELKSSKISAFSNFFIDSLTKDEKYFSGKCEQWYREDPGTPTDILPCPPLARQAYQDPRFKVADGTFETKTLNFFHPGGDVSFRQRLSSPSGAGQQCVYKNGNILVGAPGGGTADRTSPNEFLGHQLNDVLPWFYCCKYSNSETDCRKYFEKRPSDSGHNYTAPQPARAAGDPHITTFDLLSYTFNGAGEFWMIRGGDNKFLMQARMEQFLATNASVFTSFAIQETNSKENGKVHVQVSAAHSGIEVLLDGQPLISSQCGEIENQENTRTVSVKGISISQSVSPNGYPDRVTLSFSSGFSFQITTTRNNALLNIIASASDQLQEEIKGLLGIFDGHSSNDLTDPDGKTILPNSTIEEIHYNFGLKWITSPGESIFIYPPGKTHESFHRPNFVPNFFIPDFSTIPQNALRMCEGSRECLFDFVTTGSDIVANATRQESAKFNNSLETFSHEIEMCQGISEPENGFYQLDNFLQGSVAIFHCNQGYSLVGQQKLQCKLFDDEDSLRWDGKTPECRNVEINHSYKIQANFFLIIKVILVLLCKS